MMQLLCNGTFLDLYEGSGLQFTHKNPLFAFDALECERTTSFKIPATPKNDRVFALAKLPALSGIAMRRKYDAELYDGTVVKKGYIYVSNFDGKDYNAIFVTGELVGLQALKNAGKIRDLLVLDQAVTWDNTTTHTADEATLPDVGFVRYERDPSTAHLNASISLRWLMEQIATKTGVTINYLNAAGDERWRLLAAGADIYNLNDLAVRLVNIPTAGQDPIKLQTLLGITIGYSAGAYIADCVAVRDDQYLRWGALQPTLQQFEMLKFAYEIALEFGEDFPDDYFIMSNGYWSMSGATWHNEEICNMYRPIGDEYYVFGPYGRCANFLGGYTFDWEGNAHGAPLAGRKVTIPANTPFALLPKSALVYREPEAVGDTATIGYDASAVPAYDYEVRISINHDFVYGEDVPLNAMLPEFTAVELLKLYAAINGCVLNYTDAQGVTFEPLDFDNYAMRDIKALTKRGELVRTFSDYAQRNIVKMTPEDWVWLGERIKTQYAIDNDNIEAEKDLLVLKASEGGKKIAYTNAGEVHTRLLVRNDAEGKRKAKDQTIALASVDDPNMLRVTIPTIGGLQNLCTASTQQKISARMTLLEYNAIQAKTLALVEGLRYIWTERSWQKNEAQFTLARLYEAGAAPVPPQPEYVQDGLVFWLDGEDIGSNEGYWTEKIGNRKFKIFGGVQHIDKAMVFDGTGYCQQDTLEQWQWFYDNATVCICMEFTGPTGRQYWAFNPYNGIGTTYLPLIMRREDGVMYYRNNGQYGILLPSSPFTFAAGGVNNVYAAITMLNKSTSINYGAGDFWGVNQSEPAFIGVRSIQSANTNFIGRIMNIMVYNRILTEDEIMQNQQVDNIRFNLGL